MSFGSAWGLASMPRNSRPGSFHGFGMDTSVAADVQVSAGADLFQLPMQDQAHDASSSIEWWLAHQRLQQTGMDSQQQQQQTQTQPQSQSQSQQQYQTSRRECPLAPNAISLSTPDVNQSPVQNIVVTPLPMPMDSPSTAIPEMINPGLLCRSMTPMPMSISINCRPQPPLSSAPESINAVAATAPCPAGHNPRPSRDQVAT